MHIFQKVEWANQVKGKLDRLETHMLESISGKTLHTTYFFHNVENYKHNRVKPAQNCQVSSEIMLLSLFIYLFFDRDNVF